MIKGQGNKRNLIIVISVVAVLLIAGITWAIISAQNSESEADPYVNQAETESPEQPAEPATVPEEEAPAELEEAATPDIDPATVSYVPIEPLGVDVAYVKGIGGFEYEVQRTQANIQYVDFSTEDLAGTKCTDDKGVFASIIKNPESDADRATLTSTKQVDDNTYGLSLPEDACTSDTELFAQYQQSFKDAFGLIRALSATTEN